MRTFVAYILSCALLVLGARWAWSFVGPMMQAPADGKLQMAVYSLVVMSAIACGLLAGAVISLLARPNQLQHASIFAGAVAVLSFAKDAMLQFTRPETPTIFTLEGLWVLPFVVSALACAGITRAKALERKLRQSAGSEVG